MRQVCMGIDVKIGQLGQYLQLLDEISHLSTPQFQLNFVHKICMTSLCCSFRSCSCRRNQIRTTPTFYMILKNIQDSKFLPFTIDKSIINKDISIKLSTNNSLYQLLTKICQNCIRSSKAPAYRIRRHQYLQLTL